MKAFKFKFLVSPYKHINYGGKKRASVGFQTKEEQ